MTVSFAAEMIIYKNRRYATLRSIELLLVRDMVRNLPASHQDAL
jgi:hypothetical protein